jgi:site-specific DNA-methyltransferase (adenine-specific)
MTLAQKPTDGTYVNNWLQHHIGLINVTERLNENFPGNLMPVPKPVKSEKGDYNNHVSVKPLVLIEHLIKLLTPAGATVLDPFLGSGTTLVACERTGRNCIGFELSPTYFEIIKQRLQDCG